MSSFLFCSFTRSKSRRCGVHSQLGGLPDKHRKPDALPGRSTSVCWHRSSTRQPRWAPLTGFNSLGIPLVGHHSLRPYSLGLTEPPLVWQTFAGCYSDALISFSIIRMQQSEALIRCCDGAANSSSKSSGHISGNEHPIACSSNRCSADLHHLFQQFFVSRRYSECLPFAVCLSNFDTKSLAIRTLGNPKLCHDQIQRIFTEHSVTVHIFCRYSAFIKPYKCNPSSARQ